MSLCLSVSVALCLCLSDFLSLTCLSISFSHSAQLVVPTRGAGCAQSGGTGAAEPPRCVCPSEGRSLPCRCWAGRLRVLTPSMLLLCPRVPPSVSLALSVPAFVSLSVPFFFSLSLRALSFLSLPHFLPLSLSVYAERRHGALKLEAGEVIAQPFRYAVEETEFGFRQRLCLFVSLPCCVCQGASASASASVPLYLSLALVFFLCLSRHHPTAGCSMTLSTAEASRTLTW